MGRELTDVGTYNALFNKILGISLPCKKIYKSKGLVTHIEKKHANCLAYLGHIPDIIKNPDYIGTNAKEPNSIEVIKRYDKNILVAIKLDTRNDYYYVASLYAISEGKLLRRLHSKRIKIYAEKV